MNININNETEIAFTKLNGTADNGDTYFQVYHRLIGVAIWGTVIKGTEADAQNELRRAMEQGEAQAVADREVTRLEGEVFASRFGPMA